jgi:hypothetical protein
MSYPAPRLDAMDESIRVDSAVKERLAVMARERGMTIRDYLRELAGIAPPTPEEVAERAAAARAYLKANICPDLDEDPVATEWFWNELKAGRIPKSLRPPWESDGAAA